MRGPADVHAAQRASVYFVGSNLGDGIVAICQMESILRTFGAPPGAPKKIFELFGSLFINIFPLLTQNSQIEVIFSKSEPPSQPPSGGKCNHC